MACIEFEASLITDRTFTAGGHARDPPLIEFSRILERLKEIC